LAYADVILPACSQFEHDDLFAAYGTHWLQRAEPVIPPQGEALPNTEIFRRLAARFGFDDPAFTATDAQLMDDAIDGADPRLGGVRPSRIPPDAALLMTFDGAPANLFANVLPTTPSGKVELASSYLEKKFGARLPSYRPFTSSYPLILITPASDRRTMSTFGGCTANAETPPLEIHPDDAGTRVRCAVGTGPDEVRAETTVPTTTPAETLRRVLEFFRAHTEITAVGAACFGPIDLDRSSPTFGRVTTTPKPGWRGADVVGPLRPLAVPVAFAPGVTRAGPA